MPHGPGAATVAPSPNVQSRSRKLGPPLTADPRLSDPAAAKTRRKCAIFRVTENEHERNPHCRDWLAAIFFAPPRSSRGRGSGDTSWILLTARLTIRVTSSSERESRGGFCRRLFDSTQMGVGYRVLDVGCGRGELCAYLDSLGIRCAGIDESAVHVVEAQRAAPACDFTCGSINNAVNGPQGRIRSDSRPRGVSAVSDLAVGARRPFRGQFAVVGPRPSGRVSRVSWTRIDSREQPRRRDIGSCYAAFRLVAGNLRFPRDFGRWHFARNRSARSGSVRAYRSAPDT